MNVDLPLSVLSLVLELQRVPGVAAIALGGSRARGTHTPASDIDLALYYDPSRPLDMAALASAAAQADDQHRPDAVTPPGAWGRWINGGAWLQIEGQAVDLLYRDLDDVHGVIDELTQGCLRVDYQPGHPHAFVSAMYLAEAAICRPLWDPQGRLAALKRAAHPYPARMKAALIERFLWEAAFSIATGSKALARGDVHYLGGCAFRAVNCLLQVLFALNEQHWLNEKGALALAEGFAVRPSGLSERVQTLYAALDVTGGGLKRCLGQLQELERDVRVLVSA